LQAALAGFRLKTKSLSLAAKGRRHVARVVRTVRGVARHVHAAAWHMRGVVRSALGVAQHVSMVAHHVPGVAQLMPEAVRHVRMVVRHLRGPVRQLHKRLAKVGTGIDLPPMMCHILT
jgi:hypothetical protein